MVDVPSRFKDAKVVGEKSGEPFGHKRFTSFMAWRADQPHTLVFEVTRPENDNRVVVDEGVAR